MANAPEQSTSSLSSTTLITYPARDDQTLEGSSSATASSRQAAKEAPRIQVKERLYIGNLHSTVDEYTLIQLFSRFGKIAKLDFLFHKTGPMKGKPRGYAFVEYADAESAAKALQVCNQKLLRGRKLSVTFATQAPDFSTSGRPRIGEVKTTSLSLLKTPNKPIGTQSKIAALEAKLKRMEQERELKSGNTEPAGESSLPPRPAHLPPKPRG